MSETQSQRSNESDDHTITAKIQGKATLTTPPESPRETGEWSDEVQHRHHYECSCGAQIGDSRQAVFNHLLENNALDE